MSYRHVPSDLERWALMSQSSAWKALLACAAALLVFANVGLWITRGLADESRFSEAAADIVARDDIRRSMAESIVREALAEHPLLYRMARQPAESAVADLLATRGMQATLNIVARHVHRMLVTDERPTFLITAPLLQAIALAVAFVAPPQAASLTFDGQSTRVELFARQDIPTYGGYVDAFRVGAPLAAIGALSLILAAVLASGDRARGLRRVSYILLAAFAATLLSILPLRFAIVARIDDAAARMVTAGVFDQFIWILIAQSSLLLVAGGALWLVARQLRRPVLAAHEQARTIS